MVRKLSLILSLVLIGWLPVLADFPALPRALADEGAPIDNGERRVSDHGFRFGADQGQPDISGDYVVWLDNRGDSDEVSSEPFGHIWSKNLSTRDEAPVKTSLATHAPQPRVSGEWAVWTDHTPANGSDPSNDDIYACQLPCTGSPLQITTDTAHQMNPAIDGTTVVWEDYRNEGVPGQGVDIFMKDLSDDQAEAPVVEAPGNQTSPSVSGGTVAWRDSRDVALPEFNDSDVWVKVGNEAPVKAAEAAGNARSLSAFQAAVSGTRLLWNVPDPACGGTGASDCENPKILKTCVLGNAGCGPMSDVDSVSSSPESFTQITGLDLYGLRAAWVKQGPNDAHAYTRDLATSGDIVPVDDNEFGLVDSVRVDGQRFAWTQCCSDGSDVFWRDATTQPRRASSISLGSFGGHSGPAADGDLVLYRRAPSEVPGTNEVSPLNQVWATDLTPRRYFPVSTQLVSDNSRPAIVGDRVVFSTCVGGSCGPVFERTVTGPEGLEPPPPKDISRLGPPDADGSRTAWRCGDSEICVHDGTSLESLDVSAFFEMDPEAFSVLSLRVRISGTRVAWFEFSVAPGCDPDTQECDDVNERLHVMDVGTDPPEDKVIDQGGDLDGGDFDISGSNVVWAGGGTIRHADVADAGCTGPDTCPQVLVAQPDHTLFDPSIDGDRVAWVGEENLGEDECCGARVIFTMTLMEADYHLVTNETPDVFEAVASPYVDGDRIYWVDRRDSGTSCCSSDIFVESATGPTGLDPDGTAPANPANFMATVLGNGVELSWTNPSDDDFYRVRILRKSGSAAPGGIDDTTSLPGQISASVVYEGSGTKFTDIDVVPGVQYSYTIFAFDHEPNFSTGVSDLADVAALCPGYEAAAGNHVVGGPGDDVLEGTQDRDIVCGLGGDDMLTGADGNDVLLGGPGSDRLTGGNGNDRLFGDAGRDVLRGGRGRDRLDGGGGRDDCEGGPDLDRETRCE